MLLGETTVPAVYAFLQRKSQETYEELLNAIVNYCEQLNLAPDPDYIITDYENSLGVQQPGKPGILREFDLPQGKPGKLREFFCLSMSIF